MRVVMLEVPWPPSMNTYWRSGRGSNYLSAKGREYRENFLRQIKEHDIEPMTGRLSVHIELHPPDKRKRDLDNHLKAILDCLQHGNVIEDDEQFDEITVVRGDIEKYGCADVRILPCSPNV